jgi:hypothetical protein
MTPEEIRELFRSFERSVFRLETLDRYAVPDDNVDYRRWRQGEPAPPIDGHPWLELVRAATSTGKRWERVHTIRLPLTDYLRFELEYGYPLSEQVGERCYVLEVPEGDPLPVPPVDFWLFDDKLVLRMDYDAEGRILERVPLTDIPTVSEFRRRRELALSLATPFSVWLSQAQGAG